MLPVQSRGFNFFLLVEHILFLYPCRLPAQVVSDNFQMFHMLERQTGLHLPEKVYPVFHITFSFHPQN